jgi:hypothetical protein
MEHWIWFYRIAPIPEHGRCAESLRWLRSTAEIDPIADLARQ